MEPTPQSSADPGLGSSCVPTVHMSSHFYHRGHQLSTQLSCLPVLSTCDCLPFSLTVHRPGSDSPRLAVSLSVHPAVTPLLCHGHDCPLLGSPAILVITVGSVSFVATMPPVTGHVPNPPPSS